MTRPLRRLRPVLALLLLFATGAMAQRAADVHGVVTSPEGPLAGVVVEATVAGAERGRATTDGSGSYRLRALGAGRYNLRFERTGYVAVAREVRVGTADVRLDVRLSPRTVQLEEIVVQSARESRRERTRFETEAGVTTRVVTGQEMKLLPGLGEADPLRAMEVLPGVITTSDFTSAFNVRGGSSDQNLVLIDGFPIYNPFHLGGLFSVFNADVVARAELLSGGFGAEYGGRASSVLNVETRTFAGEGVHVEGGVSMIASRVAVHGRLPANVGGRSGGWFVSARRSYFDQLLPEKVALPYHLTDLQAGGTASLPGGGRLALTAYTGEDVLDMSRFRPDDENLLRVRWTWGNDVLGLRWTQPVGAWVTDARLGYTRFRDVFGLVEFDDQEFSSRIGHLQGRLDAARNLGADADVKVGAEVGRIRYGNLAQAGGTEFFRNGDVGVLTGAFSQLRWRPTDRWIIEPSARVDAWSAEGVTRAEVSPRFAVKRFLGAERGSALKLAGGRYTQFMHSIRDETFPLSNERWIIAGRTTPPVVSDQVQGGWERYWGERWYASVEGYARRFEGVATYNHVDDLNDPDDDITTGSGRSYGMDVLLRRSTGRLRGWGTLSLLKATRTFPDPLAAGFAGAPRELSYAPLFDRRVDLDLVLQYALPGRIEMGVRWNFGSGLPYTRPVGQYVDWEYDVRTGGYRLVRVTREDEDGEDEEEGVPLRIVTGERNAERYPAYHRLDLTFRRTYRPSWGTFVPYLQVLNAYNRQNPLFYFYDYGRTPPVRSGLTMFPVLPTIGVEVSF